MIAEAQTAGRGRRGHSWLSPPGSGLYVSVVLTPARARAGGGTATALVTLTAGVALAQGIEAATGLRVDLKWPNDLYVARRKLGGILAEGVADAVSRRLRHQCRRDGVAARSRGEGDVARKRARRPVDRARRSSPRRSRRSRAVRRPARRPVRCYPRRVARPRTRQPRRPRVVDHAVGYAKRRNGRHRRSRRASG